MGVKIGEAIKQARGKKSLRKFAQEIGISHTHLSSIERGCDPRTGKQVNLSTTTLKKISQGTGIDFYTLVGMAVDTE